MTLFTLRVKRCPQTGDYLPDSRHAFGGTDADQVWAFHHLFPDGYCPQPLYEKLAVLARTHGWKVEFTKTPPSDTPYGMPN